MSDPSPVVHSASTGGVAADHIPLPVLQTMVSPSLLTTQFNTIKSSIVPFACWRASDLRFRFGSSIVLPEMRKEIAALKKLIDRHTVPDPNGGDGIKPALTVFGHADPTGGDDFNKTLSGRRAQVIYAMLTRKVPLWDQLFTGPQGQDKWDPDAIEVMQTALGQPAQTPLASGARQTLFKAYMDFLCTAANASGDPLLDAQGNPITLELKVTDFLGNGADPGGKADFQGCGEFNPVLIFSDNETQTFSDPDLKEARDAQNAKNRRVLIFLFRPGIRIPPDVWPCPRAKEGTAACKKRFWSDGEDRRSRRLPDDERKFEETHDTFACRFYQRLSDNSPCEQTLKTFQLKLFDRSARLTPFAPFLVIRDGATDVGRADKDAILTVHDLKVPDTCKIRWSAANPGDDEDSPAPEETDTLDFELEVFVDIPGDDNTRDVALQRLHNLSYSAGPDETDNIADFQNDYRSKLPIDTLENSLGEFDSATLDVLQEVYNSTDLLVKSDGNTDDATDAPDDDNDDDAS